MTTPLFDRYQIILLGEQLARGCYLKAERRHRNLRLFESPVQRPNHYTTRATQVRNVWAFNVQFYTKRAVSLNDRRSSENEMLKQDQLECGPMPNVMVALPNIGGAFCSTPQRLADAHY